MTDICCHVLQELSCCVEATFRISSFEGVVEVLSLCPHVEVLGPPDLRAEIADRMQRTARLYEGLGTRL